MTMNAAEGKKTLK